MKDLKIVFGVTSSEEVAGCRLQVTGYEVRKGVRVVQAIPKYILKIF